MGENLQIALGTIGFVLAIACPFIINRILKFKLEIEKMRLETEIKKEEIRAKNQLDIESMMARDHIRPTNGSSIYKKADRNNEDYSLEEETRKERLKY